MSRLYAWLNTDMIKTTKTARGNEKIDIRVHYGSKDDSKPLLNIFVNYPKNSEIPEVSIWQRGKKIA